MLLFQVSSTVNAQVKIPHMEYKEVKEGNLAYLLHSASNSITFSLERPETKDLDGKSYEYFYARFEKDYNDRVLFPIVRSVFSKERANQLAGLKISCIIGFSPAENKILHIRFIIIGEKDRSKDDVRIPFKLSELDELERKLRAEPNLIPFKSSGKIVNHAEGINLPIVIDRLYADKD